MVMMMLLLSAGPCEALLTMANMFIALGMHQAVSTAQQTSALSPHQKVLGVVGGLAHHRAALGHRNSSDLSSAPQPATPQDQLDRNDQDQQMSSSQYMPQVCSMAAGQHTLDASSASSATTEVQPVQGGVRPGRSEMYATHLPDTLELGSDSTHNSSGSSSSGTRRLIGR